MSEYCVYKHTAPCGKVYIGITSQTPSVRWKNGRGYADNPYFFNAILKYGWENIRHDILYESLTKDEAEEKEKNLILYYRSYEREHGYNIAMGGNTTTPSEESRAKASAAMVEAWSDESFRERVSRAMRGVKRTDAARHNISEAQKKRFQNEEERRLVSERQIGRTRSEDAKRKTSDSLKKYYSDPENREALKLAREDINRKYHARSVVCVETGEVFEAVVDAAKKYGIDHRNISAVCKGKRSVAGGLHWNYGTEVKHGAF